MKIYIFLCKTNTGREFQAICVEPMNRYNFLLEGEEMQDCTLANIIEKKDAEI